MALKGLVGKISGKLSETFAGQGRGPWQPEAGPYPRLMLMEEDALQSLAEVGGLYALWHRGVRPQESICLPRTTCRPMLKPSSLAAAVVARFVGTTSVMSPATPKLMPTAALYVDRAALRSPASTAS